METSKPITVQTYKYDGHPHRNWNAELIERNGDLLVLRGVFDRQIDHENLGTIQPGTVSYEYYWLGRWYNVFRFHEPDGSFRNFYCNINLPPKFENNCLEYVDMDLDIYVSKEMELELLDGEEFKANISLYGYPPELIRKIHETVTELSNLIKARKFPFDVDVKGLEFKL